MIKICLIGFRNANLGDEIIYNATEYLVKKSLSELNYTDYEIISVNMDTEDFSEISNANLIIFAGGGIIKYKYQKFYYYIDTITRIAQEHSIPVYFHAVGVEGYDSDNEECKILKEALNRLCVKQISTRDDLETLKHYISKNTGVKLLSVPDAAVCTSEVYGIKKQPTDKLVGLGVVREGIFRSNGIDIGLEELLLLWSGIIKELESKGYQWQIFTTGWPSDMKFAVNLMNYLGMHDNISDKVVPSPSDPNELIHTISSYQAVIAGRLHANIVSYALDIPSIGIVWNDKLNFFGKSIGFPQRFINVDNFHPEKIVTELEQAIQTGYSEELRSQQQAMTYNSIKEILASII